MLGHNKAAIQILEAAWLHDALELPKSSTHAALRALKSVGKVLARSCSRITTQNRTACGLPSPTDCGALAESLLAAHQR
jgi:hypothetical protein